MINRVLTNRLLMLYALRLGASFSCGKKLPDHPFVWKLVKCAFSVARMHALGKHTYFFRLAACLRC